MSTNKIKKTVKISENDLVNLIDNLLSEAVVIKKQEWISEQTKKGNKTPLLEQKLEALTAQVQELIKKIISEDSSWLADDNYTHFGVSKSDNKICSSWNYSDIDGEDLKSDPNHYFWSDLKDNYPESKKSDFRIMTRKGLEKQGVDINDQSNWYNTNI